jgi:iron complex transport system substrate-binding protein
MAHARDIVDGYLQHASRFPSRIACLTEEPTETLYRLGCGDKIVGVSCFTTRPKEAKEKPTISSFLDARFDELVATQPDLVIGFSDLQADIARELAKRAIPVVIFNQRSIAEILQTIRATGALVGEMQKADALADELTAHLRKVAAHAQTRRRRPRVYFEEWPDPQISAIRWVSELIDIAGGDDVFSHSRSRPDAKGRIFSIDDVVIANPDAILASWCGKTVDVDSIVERFSATTAVKNGAIREVNSDIILQPGPAALSDGIDALSAFFDDVA